MASSFSHRVRCATLNIDRLRSALDLDSALDDLEADTALCELRGK